MKKMQDFPGDVGTLTKNVKNVEKLTCIRNQLQMLLLSLFKPDKHSMLVKSGMAVSNHKLAAIAVAQTSKGLMVFTEQTAGFVI